MRWLRDSILTVDNRNVPNNIAEIKTILNNIKTFRLEEYASRLKDKKKLIQIYNELMETMKGDEISKKTVKIIQSNSQFNQNNKK
jgi:hypothetical protein